MLKWLSKFCSPQQLYDAGVLGMNARNFHIISKHNQRRLYPLVDDKVQTKTLANNIGISTPKLIGKIEHQYEVKNIYPDTYTVPDMMELLFETLNERC